MELLLVGQDATSYTSDTVSVVAKYSCTIRGCVGVHDANSSKSSCSALQSFMVASSVGKEDLTEKRCKQYTNWTIEAVHSADAFEVKGIR